MLTSNAGRDTLVLRGGATNDNRFSGALACAVQWRTATPVQPFPTHPVALIVPYGAGGPLDALARIVSEQMRVSLGQPLLCADDTILPEQGRAFESIGGKRVPLPPAILRKLIDKIWFL